MPGNKQTKSMEKVVHPNLTNTSANDGREKDQEQQITVPSFLFLF